jgi:hypothetical protein
MVSQERRIPVSLVQDPESFNWREWVKILGMKWRKCLYLTSSLSHERYKHEAKFSFHRILGREK